MVSTVNINIVERDGKAFVVYEGDEFELMTPRSVDSGFWQGMGSGLARSFERQTAMFGLSMAAGKRVAGEFILQSRLAFLTSIGMPEGYKLVPVTLRNDVVSCPYPIMFASGDLERIVYALRQSGDGLAGPRGSVFVMGQTEVRGTWPMRQPVLCAKNWMVLGNTNDVGHMISECAKGGYKMMKLAMNVQDFNRKTLP